MKHNRLIPLLLFLLSVAFFFLPVFVSQRIPIPADTIVGLYHPYRDLYAASYPRGIPFKNFLVTDPVRQQFPWRTIVVEAEKKLSLPLWNPYSFAGTPLLANYQSASFYPLNLFYFLLPFTTAWSLQVILQPILAGIFLYLYLRSMKLSTLASTLGAVSFAFSGFSIAWLEWNTIVQTAMWVPLLLLIKELYLKERKWKWIVVLFFAESSLIFAGHIQTAFYSLIVINVYLTARIFQLAKSNSIRQTIVQALHLYKPFLGIGLLVACITAIHWLPSLQFILQSARDVDQEGLMKAGWFIPWQHLIQFLVPDFFGNPATGNYWGVWNYAEFIGYIGIIPLILAFFAMFFRHDRKTLFFGTLFFLSLIFSLPTFFASLPFILHIPFLSSAQPTRLLFVADLSLSILAALGLDRLEKEKKGLLWILFSLGIVFFLLWLWVLYGGSLTDTPVTAVAVAKRNLLYSTGLYALAMILFIPLRFTKKQVFTMVCYLLLILSIADLLRFGKKFTPFSEERYLYPSTKTIAFLQKHAGLYRIMSTDSQILPPNFSLMHKLYSVDGYDPLYLKRYGELIAALERGEPNIDPPFGFNRIITPKRYDSALVDLLGVKYVLSLSDIHSQKLKKVFQEGETRVYENTSVLPRVFFVEEITNAKNNKEAMQFMFKKTSFRVSAVNQTFTSLSSNKVVRYSIGEATISSYGSESIIVKTKNKGTGYMVLTDSFYPTWRARIVDGDSKGKDLTIFQANYAFRGVIVPKGENTIEFYNTLF